VTEETKHTADLIAAAKVLLDYDEQDAGCIPTDAHLDAQEEVRIAIAKAESPSPVSKLLWMMHVRGPDDVYPAPDYETAVLWCDYVNYRLAVPDVMMAAVPGIWIYSPEQHAASLPQAIADWTLPLDADGKPQAVMPILKAEGSPQ